LRHRSQFGEELESALRDKFADHWYPDKPFKGSAYRCLKITDPADPVLNRAARESGNPVTDIIENLPGVNLIKLFTPSLTLQAIKLERLPLAGPKKPSILFAAKA
jgi:BTG family